MNNMAENNLFSEEELKALIDLVDIMQKADPEGNVYNMPLSTSDTLVELIKRDNSISNEEKERLLKKIDKRKKNQIAVENLSRRATDIQMGKNLLGVREEEKKEKTKDEGGLEL